MNHKIRATLGLLVLSSALVSCTTMNDADVYTVEFYTDYEGIEYAAGKLNKNRATKVGEGYVVKGRANQTARLTSLEKDGDGKAIDYENSRQKKEGHTYTWDSWKGFYGKIEPEVMTLSNGTAIGEDLSGTEVNLKEIKGDCAVFAYFSDTINTYNVTIQNGDAEIYKAEEPLEYGTKLGDALTKEFETEEKAKEALTLNSSDYNLPRYYYQVYTFDGYKDGDGKTYTVDELFDLEIKDDLKLSAVFNGPDAEKYTVSFYKNPKDSSSNELLNETEEVAYGAAVKKTLLDYTSDHEVYTFKGWEGTYAENAIDEVKGKSVDYKHILYDCALYPVYEPSPEEITITFLNYDGSSISEKTVPYGSSFEGVLLKEIDDSLLPGGEVFTGLWSKEQNDVSKNQVIDPSGEVEENLTLYPVTVQKSIDAKGEKGDLFTYEYSLDWDGYLVTKFTPSSTRSDTETELSEDDMGLSFLGAFKLVGVKKLSDDTEDYSSSLTDAVFPSSVKYVAPNAFRGNKRLKTLNLPGLQKVDSFGFSQLYALSNFILPSSLTSIGSRAFYGCTKLGQTGKIKVEMSKDVFDTNVEHASDWEKIGEGDANVEFQS